MNQHALNGNTRVDVSGTPVSAERISWALLASAFCGLVALMLATRIVWLPAVVLLICLVSLFTPRRIALNSPVLQSVRGIFILGLILISWTRFNSENGDPPEIVLAYGAGQWAACEFALRCWLRGGFVGERRIWGVLLPALIIMGASNTFELEYIRFLVPLYVLFAVLYFMEGGHSKAFTRPERSRFKLSLFRYTAIVFVLICGMASHATVLIYRYELGQLGAKLMGERHSAETVGLSTQPRLGATFGASGSLSRVLRIEGLPASENYFRALTFDTYNDGQWLPGPDGRTYKEQMPHDLNSEATGQRVRVHRLIDDAGLLLAPLHTIGVSAPAEAKIELARGGPLRSKDPAPEPFFYDLVMQPGKETQGIFCEKPTPGELEKLLAVPAEIPMEVRLLAQKIGGHTVDQREQIHVVESYLMSHHAYSLSTDPGAGDPTSNFLMGDKAAHCEYFASASAILLRCLGVPSRYVVGYYVHEIDGPGQATVRMRDAHAWTECYVSGTGWVTMDATPGGARPNELGEPVSFWLKLRERIQDAIMLVRNTLAYIAQHHPALGIASLVGVAGLYALGRFLIGRRKRQQKLTPVGYTTRSEELGRLGRRFEKWLRRNGMPAEPGKTWHESLQSQGTVLESNGLAREWLRLYNAARFGPQTQAAQLTRLAELLQRLEQEPIAKPVTPVTTASPTSTRN
jgi:hypothetical protein